MLPKVVGQPQFNLLGELKTIYVKIPLLQALQDIPIYAITFWDLCTRKPGRKPRDLPHCSCDREVICIDNGKNPLGQI